MGFWKKDDLESLREANPEQTKGMSDEEVLEWADDERATQEGMLGRDFTEEGEA